MSSLVVLDIDGTLTASLGIDTDCFAEAATEHFGLRTIDTRWERYTSSTDSGLLREILDAAGLELREGEIAAFEDRFFGKLEASLRRDRMVCQPIPGARELVRALAAHAEFSVAMATGGFARTARLKLDCAGVGYSGIPFASSNDSDRREEIISIAIERAGGHGGRMSDVTYVGDGIWDVKATRNLGCRFIGIASSPAKEMALKAAGASVVLSDHSDIDRFLELVSPPR